MHINYKLDISSINYWNSGNVPADFTKENGFEVGMYSAWYPIEMSKGNFHYEINVKAPKGYQILANGEVSKQETTKWKVLSNVRQFDIPLIISNRLERKVYNFNGSIIELSHFGKSQEEVDNLANDIQSILTLYNERFGDVSQTGIMRFAFVPRDNRASYSRKGFSAINSSGSELVTFSTIAHEIGHFWWAGADSASWEDWLNESFAEFSALLAIKLKYGDKKYSDRIASFSNMSQNSPPIWGLDRASDISTLVLYKKGPIILTQAQTKFGKRKFNKVARSLIGLNKKNTNAFLSKVEQITNKKEREWLEHQLHQ